MFVVKISSQATNYYCTIIIVTQFWVWRYVAFGRSFISFWLLLCTQVQSFFSVSCETNSWHFYQPVLLLEHNLIHSIHLQITWGPLICNDSIWSSTPLGQKKICKGAAVATTYEYHTVGIYLKISSFFLKHCYRHSHQVNTLINEYIVIDLKIL